MESRKLIGRADPVEVIAASNDTYTEEPMYSFQAGVPLPLAVELRSCKPELMLLRNNSRPHLFHDLLSEEYQLIYVGGDNMLYGRKTIANSPQH